MSKHDKSNQARTAFWTSSSLALGSVQLKVAVIEEQHRTALTPDQKVAQECTRLASLCQYFSQQRMDIPPEIVEQVAGLSRLATPERIRVLIDVSRALMEYLNDVGQDPGIRQ